MRRGETVNVSFDPARGSEASKTRPAVIVSNDAANATAFPPCTNCASAQTAYPTNGHPFDEGGNLSARWRTGETTLGLRGAGDFGDEGDRAGADLSGEHVIETRYVVSGRAGVWQWNDKLRPDRDTTSFNYVASVGYRFAQGSQAMVDWEHDINGLVGQRFRLMLWLKLGVTK